jgi:hypothetical protein
MILLLELFSDPDDFDTACFLVVLSVGSSSFSNGRFDTFNANFATKLKRNL